jgi:hypothetical protein
MCILVSASDHATAAPETPAPMINTSTDRSFQFLLSFRDGPKDQTRNLEIPGSMLRIAPE